MATPFSGKEGEITVFTANAEALGTAMNVTNWSLSVTDSAPGTAHSNSDEWVVSFLGVQAWSATIDVLMDSVASTTIPEVDDEVTAITLTDGPNSYVAPTGGVISNVSYSCDIAGGGLMTASLSVSGDGAMGITGA
jgi:hypothetical protein